MGRRWTGAVLALTVFLAGGNPASAEDQRAVFSTAGAFADIKQFTELAITGRGYTISHYSDIGTMLARTAEDVGATDQVYLDGGVIEFCSATLSRQMMEADPGNMVFCPFAIALYVLPSEPDRVYAAFERISGVGPESSRPILREIETVLEGIIKEAME